MNAEAIAAEKKLQGLRTVQSREVNEDSNESWMNKEKGTRNVRIIKNKQKRC